MRQINKSPAHISRFNSWASSTGMQKWDDFGKLFHEVYERVLFHLAVEEQSELSAYSEKPLGKFIHIDHFRKRNLYPKLIFDYSNFLVDDLNDNYGACYKDNHAGITKNTFDGQDRIFCPVSENMADFVEFMIDGTIKPKNDIKRIDASRVNETIRVFNLNHKTLKDIRSNIIREVSVYKSCGLDDFEIHNSLASSGFPTLVNWALMTL